MENTLPEHTRTESALISKLDSYVDSKSSAYCTRIIEDDEMVAHAFCHVNAESVQSIFLRGSRATGRITPYSDVDLLILLREGTYNSVTFKDEHGVRYNMQLFSEKQQIESCPRFFYGMRPIYDDTGGAEAFAVHLNDLEKGICEKRSKDDFDSLPYLRGLVGHIGDDDVFASSFFKAKLMREYPAFLAAYNGFDLLGFKHTIDCLLRDAYDVALLYAKAMDRDSGQAEAKELIERSFSAPCGLNVLDTDFTHSPLAFDVAVGSKSMYEMYNACSDFVDFLRLLKNGNKTVVDFLRECKDAYPKLYTRLWDLTH